MHLGVADVIRKMLSLARREIDFKRSDRISDELHNVWMLITIHLHTAITSHFCILLPLFLITTDSSHTLQCM
jgi:hypothetical protein